MNIDTMKAGLEMDALVAEKVMGLKLREDCCGEYEYEIVPNEPSSITCWARLPEYSTEIEAAWDIMDHLIDLHPAIMWENCEWECCLDDHNKGHGEQFWGYADTAPLAICRAALKAVEEI